MANSPELIANFTKRCTTDAERKLLAEAIEHSIEIDVNIRWETGMPHHPESKRIAHLIGDTCWVFGYDLFCFKFGGDGDNGESLQYVLDIYFETQDKIKAKAQS